MEEAINCIKRACELARELESELPNMTNQPEMLSLSIDEVSKAFIAAKEMLTTAPSASSSSFVAPMLSGGGYVQRMDQLFQMQPVPATSSTTPFDVRALLDMGGIGGRDVHMEGSSERSKGSEGAGHALEASPSRPRKRKNDAEKRTVMVRAPQFGNTEVPPDDGFTWRKYGQKEILGRIYPRGYFRCTHQKLYECPAKKQVQRLDHNPNIFEVTYRGEHTCHMSSTAPSSSVPPSQLLVDISKDMMSTQSTNIISPQLSPSSASVSGWMSSSVNLSLHGGGCSVAPAGAGGDGASSVSARPSSSRYGTGDDLVADMANAMFNTGSSSGNSMESLFPTTSKDKWEPSEKKS